jgi:hypothetical protein
MYVNYAMQMSTASRSIFRHLCPLLGLSSSGDSTCVSSALMNVMNATNAPPLWPQMHRLQRVNRCAAHVTRAFLTRCARRAMSIDPRRSCTARNCKLEMVQRLGSTSFTNVKSASWTPADTSDAAFPRAVSGHPMQRHRCRKSDRPGMPIQCASSVSSNISFRRVMTARPP